MKRVLLINFGRMGDLLQTGPLITFLKEQNPQIKVGYLAASAFSQVMQGLPEVDYLHPLNLAEYMLPLKNADILASRQRFQKLLEQLSKYNYDVVFNLTHNRMGATLSFLLSCQVTGITLDANGYLSVENPWLRQFYNSNINRGLNQFNLVDLYCLAAGFNKELATPLNRTLRFNISSQPQDWAHQLLLEKNWQPDKKIIGFQLGASAPAKQWNPEYFLALATALSSEYQAVFFGTEKEKPMVAKVAGKIPSAINLCGKTDIPQLAAMLEKCSLLISNDTGTQHLASAVGTKVLSLTLGPAYASETAPFGDGHIVIEPDIDCFPCNYRRPCKDYICHTRIKPELVEAVARNLLAGMEASSAAPELTSGVKISRTAFDENALWKLEPVCEEMITFRDKVNIAYRKTWLELFNSNIINDIEIISENGKNLAKEIMDIIPAIDELLVRSSESEALTRSLCKLTPDPAANLNSIREIGDKIAANDHRISQLGELYPHLRPLTLDFNLSKEALPPLELDKLSRMTLELYQKLNAGTRLFKKHLMIPEPITRPLISAPKIATAGRNPKVLAINTPYFVTGEVIHAFERRGVDFKLVHLSPNLKNEQDGGERFIYQLIDRVKEYSPDFIFTVNHLGFDRDGFLLKELERLGIPSAIYYVDSPLLIMDDPQKLINDFSMVFCWDEYHTQRLRQLGFQNALYLPLATDINYFHPRNPLNIPPQFKAQIIFAADSLCQAIQSHSATLSPMMIAPELSARILTEWRRNGKPLIEILETTTCEFEFSTLEQRRRFMSAHTMIIYQKDRLSIIKNLLDLGLNLHGDDDWKNLLDNSLQNFKPPLRYFEQLPLAYSGADIGFNATSYQMPGGLNQRVFDLPASATFLLTDYRPQLEAIFDLNNDLAVYHSPEEARELAQFYLNHPDLRRKMAISARQKILLAHTYDHRIQTILEKMSLFRTKTVPGQIKISTPPEQKSNPDLSHLSPELELIQREFPQTLDVPKDISIHRFVDKSLIIAPERAAWIVTDGVGEYMVKNLSAGMSMGAVATLTATNFNFSGETALHKLRQLMELMNVANFRQNFDTSFIDIDKNPRNLQLFLTRRCNLNCRHCYFSAGKPMALELSTPEWKEVIRKFALLGQGSVVTFTGGEPLVHPDFFYLAESALNYGLTSVLLTNGVLIDNPALARKIATTFDYVQISMDGVSAPVNDGIRGHGSFNRSFNAVKLLLQEKAEVEITCVVLPENVADLENNLTRFINSFNSSRLKYALSVANPKGRLEGTVFTGEQSLVGRVISACTDAPWLRTGTFQSACRNFGCHLSKSIVINPEGYIGTCPYLNYSGPLNVRSGDFAQLVSEDREWHRYRILQSEKCKSCNLRNFQCGGCRIFGQCNEQIKLRSYYRMMYSK